MAYLAGKIRSGGTGPWGAITMPPQTLSEAEARTIAQWLAAGYNSAAFDAKTLPDLMKALGGAAPTESKDVTITGPDIAENGAVVPVGAATSLPGVKRLLLLVEKNPAMLSAMFDVSDAVQPSFSTRVKMGQSSNVFAVAMTADGRVLCATKDSSRCWAPPRPPA